jgi:hypothetical protein
VVVEIEASFSKGFSLLRRQHSQRHASFKAERFNALHHRDDDFDVTLLRAAPGGPHTVAGSSAFLCLACFFYDMLNPHQLGRVEAGRIAGRLTAITAIFGASSGFYAEQLTKLYSVRIKVLSMHGMCPEQEIIQRQLIQRARARGGPTRGRRAGRRSLTIGRHECDFFIHRYSYPTWAGPYFRNEIIHDMIFASRQLLGRIDIGSATR